MSPCIRRRFLRRGSLAVSLALAGCSSDGDDGNSGDNGDDEEFGLSNLVFAAEKPGGYMDYEEQPDATYDVSDVVWLYMNVDGITYEENDDGTKEIWITEQLTVTNPEGETILDQEVVNSHQNLPEEYDPEKLYLSNNVTLPSDSPSGDYRVDVEATDKLGEQTASASTTFTVA